MLNFIKHRVQHLKQHSAKLFYRGAHESYTPQKKSVSDSIFALEPRIMFDAAGVETAAEIAAENVAEQQAEQALNSDVHPQDSDVHAQAVNHQNEDADELIAALSDLAPTSNRNEIIFIDKSVEDYQSLIAGIGSDAELVFIDSITDGLELIANVLDGRTNVDAIHIISHGNSGELFLGNSTVTQESMQGEFADELATIKTALGEDADILIYGCNFAEGDFGKSAADTLADLTGADVAASDDLTGHERLGGDWDLELQLGEIETSIIVNEQAQASWRHVLVDTDGDSVDDSTDLDDDNDGILDSDEPLSPKITNWTAAGGANVTTSGDTLTYAYTGANGWNSSVHSDNVSALGYTDKYEVSFTVNTTASKAFMVGLNEAGTNSTASYNDIDYAFYINGNTIRVYENGANKGTFGTYAANDTFSIEVDGTSLRYQHNGTTFRTVAITSGKDYYLDSSFNGSASYATYDAGNFAINPLSGANDADSDGVENRIDLDSDNDGISDLVESGATSTITAYDTNNDGSISLAEGTAAGGTLNNGVWDFFGAPGGADGTTVIDTDSDGVKNFLDLDSDGDTIADTVEARATAGYVTNDGDVRDNDADGDGVIDMFDSNDGTTKDFGGTFTAAVDTDGDGAADYIDTDSDNDTALDSAEAGAITIAASYKDPDGSISAPGTDLLNEFGDTSEVAYRESVNAPINTTPITLNIDEDVSLFFTGSNQISVTDPNGNLVSTKVTVLNGILNVTLSGGATISSGANGSSSLTISGSEIDINTALISLSYKGNPDFNGMDMLTVRSTDASGSPLVDIDTVNITVNPVVDGIIDSFIVNQKTILNADVSVNDLHSGVASFSLNTDATNGTVTMNANGTFTYIPDAGYIGADIFTYDVVDGSDTETVTVSLAVIAAASESNDDFSIEEISKLDIRGNEGLSVLDKVDDSTNSLNAKGAVLDVVDSANSDSETTSTRVNDFLTGEIDPFALQGAKVFTVNFSLTELNNRGQENPSSLFPLRVDVSDTDAKDELIIRSLLRDSTVFVKVDYELDSDLSLFVNEIIVQQLNGEPLPDWLKINDDGKLISGVFPVGVESIAFRIELRFSNDTVIVRYVDVVAATGKITSLQVTNKGVIARTE